jgi:predicted nucleotidyltransferase
LKVQKLQGVEREEILARVQEVSEVLKNRFKAKRVILFGSLAHYAWFTEDSDVDLVVEGLMSRNYWKAWKIAEEIIHDRPVDLIEVETCSDSLKRAIERYGIEI